MKSPFEIMFEKISQSSTKQVAEIVRTIEEKSEFTKEENFVRFVAIAVLEERFPEFFGWRISQAITGEQKRIGQAFAEFQRVGA
jgi:hypothetical protein